MVLGKEGFNQWAAQYDQTVAQTQADSQYPFAGYDAVLQVIKAIVVAKPQPEVLFACRDQAGEQWDAEEIYLTREQLKPVFAKQLQGRRCSFCAELMSFGAD